MDKVRLLEKEVDLIQGCIARMSQNSFSIKGWTIAFAVAIIALFPEDVSCIKVCTLVVGITVLFWGLDAFYLRTETLYRWKYEWVIANRLEFADFLYDLNPYNEKMWLSNNNNIKKKPTILQVMFSKTLWPFYLLIILIAIGVVCHELFFEIKK